MCKTTYKVLISILLVLFFGFDGKAQEKQTFTMLNGNKIIDKTVWVNVKPRFRDICTDNSINSPLLDKVFGKIQVSKVERKFKEKDFEVTSPELLAKGYVDLSLIFEIKYTANYPVDFVIAKLEQTKLFEYAEPSYFRDLMYVPSDPYASLDSTQLYHLDVIKAYDAWDIEKGDTNVVVGSLDTGVRMSHEDLRDQIKINYSEYPPDGNDDDGNGKIDDYQGFDVASNDNNPEFEHPHGNLVAGCSSADTDNGKGIASSGFNCKLWPIKVYNWNGSAFTAFKGYEGVAYASRTAVKVINLSWGSPGAYSQTEQNIINFAAINKDISIVAAAGNNAPMLDYYPASYENVLSVGGIWYNDEYMSTITRSYNIDITVPYRIYGLEFWTDSAYNGPFDGTSFSAPVAAGAVALVRSHFPNLNSVQAIEQIRVTSDYVDTLGNNEQFQYMFGKGRLNMYRALTDTLLPSVRSIKTYSRTGSATLLNPSDTAVIFFKYKNYLKPTTNLTVKLVSRSYYVTVIDSIITIGALGTLDTTSNYQIPFKILVSSLAPANTQVLMNLVFEDGTTYSDYQNVVFKINPDYISFNVNKISTTATSRGRFGFNNDYRDQGVGVNYRAESVLWDMGILVAMNDTLVSSAIRNTPENEFYSLQNIKTVNPYPADYETYNYYSDSLASNRTYVTIHQNTMVWQDAPNDKYVMLKYKLHNPTSTPISNVYFGNFADWDIQNAYANKAAWDTANSFGYAYLADTSATYANKKLYTGIKVLNNHGSARHYAIDNDQGIAGNPFGTYDDFTDAEKYFSLSTNAPRNLAGDDQLIGRDIAHVVGSGPYTIAPGDSVILAFALMVGDSLADIRQTAVAAQTMYNTLTAPLPTVTNVSVCYGSAATISPGGANNFKFYDDSTSTTPIHTGSSFTIDTVTYDMRYYVTNADSSYESQKVGFWVNVLPSQTFFTISLDTFRIGVNTNVAFTSYSPSPINSLWKFGDGDSATTFSATHVYTNPGTYTVTLTCLYANGCIVTYSGKVVAAWPQGIAYTKAQSPFNVFPNPVTDMLYISAEDNSALQSYKITDMLGRVVLEKDNIDSNTATLDCAKLPDGIYQLQIVSGDRLFTEKIVKE